MIDAFRNDVPKTLKISKCLYLDYAKNAKAISAAHKKLIHQSLRAEKPRKLSAFFREQSFADDLSKIANWLCSPPPIPVLRFLYGKQQGYHKLNFVFLLFFCK